MTEEEMIEEAWEAAGNGYLDDQIGSVDELGWFGLYGSVILYQDSQGFRYSKVYSDRDEMDERWNDITEQYEMYYEDSEDE